MLKIHATTTYGNQIVRTASRSDMVGLMAQIEFKITTTPAELVSSVRSLIKDGVAEVAQMLGKPEYRHLGVMLFDMVALKLKIFDLSDSGPERVPEDEQAH